MTSVQCAVSSSLRLMVTEQVSTAPHENAQGGGASVPFRWLAHGML